MTHLFEDNVKNTRVVGHWKTVKCKCGCTRIEAKIATDDDGDFNWLRLECKRCNNTLFYNGA